MKTPLRRAALPLAAGLLLASSSAMALDYTGYFRAGPGWTSADNTSRGCYALNGGTKGIKYRLGNECDFYGEFQLSQGFKKDGIDYSANLMVNHWNYGTNYNDSNGNGLHIEQMWAQATGFDFAPQATFWMGKERGRREDVHIVDTYFIEMAGVGGGFKGQPLGPGKLGVAVYRTDDNPAQPGSRLNVEYDDIATNTDGTLSFFATATKGDFDGGTHGVGLTARHDQKNLFGSEGLNNVLFLQFAEGSTALNANFDDLTRASKNKSWRIVESVNWQKGALGGQAMLLWASEQDKTGLKTTSGSVGGRVSYAVTKNFKLLTEVGYSQVKPEGGETAHLTKVTFAPTLAVGPGFFDRPEFRLYVTHANWNAAAGNVTGEPGYDNKTSGTSYGAQVEWWF
jgi:maltoporin